MFVGVGGTVGGKAPGMGGYIRFSIPIYRYGIHGTETVYTIQTSAMSLHCFIECLTQTARYCDGKVVDALLEHCAKTSKVLLLAMAIALSETEAGIGSRSEAGCWLWCLSAISQSRNDIDFFQDCD
jgi:hypothetical protein